MEARVSQSSAALPVILRAKALFGLSTVTDSLTVLPVPVDTTGAREALPPTKVAVVPSWLRSRFWSRKTAWSPGGEEPWTGILR